MPTDKDKVVVLSYWTEGDRGTLRWGQMDVATCDTVLQPGADKALRSAAHATQCFAPMRDALKAFAEAMELEEEDPIKMLSAYKLTRSALALASKETTEVKQ